MPRVLVLGGTRSGKSAFAEALLEHLEVVDYIAASTIPDDDPEWTARVALHQARRPTGWHTVETGDIAAELTHAVTPTLIDSVTSWLTRAMDESGSWTGGDDGAALAAAIDRLVDAWSTTTRHVVAVSDEVGSGVVPESASGRLFRDTLGMLNQRLAKAADEVYYVVAGLGQQLK